MKRISILAGAPGAFAMASMRSLGHEIVTIDRERPVSAKRRRVSAAPRFNGRSKYMPHQGAKERERAKRCYMSEFLNQQFVDDMTAHGFLLAPDMCHERSAPTLCQRARPK